MSHPRGGVSCILVASREGAVLFERHFPSLSASGALSWRAALHAAAEPVLPLARDEEEHVALHDGHTVVWLAAADLLVFAAGRGGGVDELSLAALCRALLSALRLATAKGSFSAAGVLAAFPRVCVLFEEIVSEGVVEATDVDSLQAGVRLKTAASAAS